MVSLIGCQLRSGRGERYRPALELRIFDQFEKLISVPSFGVMGMVKTTRDETGLTSKGVQKPVGKH